MLLQGSVGRGGVNQPADVKLVQRLLNNVLAAQHRQLLVEDGLTGPKTNAAIEHYQRQNGLPTDGRVDPNGPTLQLLKAAFEATVAAGLLSISSLSSDPLPLSPNGPATAVDEALNRLRG